MRRAVLEHEQVTLELANLRPASRQRQWGRTAAVTLIALSCSELPERLREWAIHTDEGVWSFRCPWRDTSSL